MSEPLKPREIDVLELLAQGLRSADIAKCLRISRRTVEGLRRRISAKLGVQSPAGLIKYAIQHHHVPAQYSSQQPLLTPREIDVLRLIAQGYSRKELVTALGVGPVSIDNTRQRIMRKLRVRSVAELEENAAWYYETGEWEGDRSPKLTRRETEVLTLVAQGLRSADIGTRLEISSRTVEHHRANIKAKLGTSKLADLVGYAIQSGLVSKNKIR